MENPEKIQDQVSRQAGLGDAAMGTGTLFTEAVLVVNQKAKIFEATTQFSVFRADGSQVGSVRQVGQSKVHKVLRLVSNFDAMMSARFEIVDNDNVLQLVVSKPRTFVKGRVMVESPDGTEIGQIVQKLRLGKAKFLLMAPGGTEQIGEVDAENFRAWNFAITDLTGTEVGRISKTWAGLGKELFTTADNYVLEIKGDPHGPLRSLIIASALTVDTLLKNMG